MEQERTIMQSSKLLVAVLVLQGLVLMSQWTSHGPVTPAHAQIPDAGGQRRQILDELRSLNQKIDRLVQTLESGKVQVSLSVSDESVGSVGSVETVKK
jgi:hypothetical protein